MENLKIKFFDSEKKCEKLTRKNLETYLSANSELELLKKVVIDPFETSLKEFVGYNDGNIPDEKKDIEAQIGRYKFNVEVKPTTTAAYAKVFNDVQDYASGLIQGAEFGRKREGVRTIDSQPHVLLDDIVDVLNDSIKNNTSSDVSKKIKPLMKNAELTEKFFEVSINDNYNDLNDANARTYLECRSQSEKIKKHITSPFVKAVKEDIGFSKNNIPGEVTYTKNPLGNALIYAVSSEADNITYGGIVDDMIQYIDEVQEFGNFRTLEGKRYLNLHDLTKTFDRFKDQHTDQSLRQSISYLRLPKPDAYIID